ncbi:hypothetical protein KO561_07685 [Radiobacillus kanasensis]|uniref:F510_1955 family glycosylhydrolase n=1 Tax=Radiobacillus kanasensis TaxID=2844358 RepID=UPI001E5A4AD3|nr:hypothetical protein [Radiobacillus kanasensis]UFU00804.1 hypothetical protein KO561_07685 [Radiobacillus kanasensis]
MKKLLIFSILIFYPVTVFAHGNEHEATSSTPNYTLIITLVLLVATLFISIYLWRKISKVLKIALVSFFILLGILTTFLLLKSNEDNPVTFTHIHGLGFSSDGTELLVPSHHGLNILHEDGHWTSASDFPQHDYMGFSPTDNGFYSSGHPDPETDLKNPLGIIKSTDGGESIDFLTLYGEVDFHGMTVGYETHDIYVFNPQPNSILTEPGFYYSTDEAKTWTRSSLTNMTGQATSLSAHPSTSGTVIVGTDQGAFLSNDYGKTMDKIGDFQDVRSVYMDHEDKIWVSSYLNQKPTLSRLDSSSNHWENISLPEDIEAPILYVQQNPKNLDQIVIATENRDIFISNDKANSWEVSVREGIAVKP